MKSKSSFSCGVSLDYFVEFFSKHRFLYYMINELIAFFYEVSNIPAHVLSIQQKSLLKFKRPIIKKISMHQKGHRKLECSEGQERREKREK